MKIFDPEKGGELVFTNQNHYTVEFRPGARIRSCSVSQGLGEHTTTQIIVEGLSVGSAFSGMEKKDPTELIVMEAAEEEAKVIVLDISSVISLETNIKDSDTYVFGAGLEKIMEVQVKCYGAPMPYSDFIYRRLKNA